MSTGIVELLAEHAVAQAYSLALIEDLDEDQIAWRPSEESSAIGWHLGHQAAVIHYSVRNLTAAEVPFNVAFDQIFDSATPEPKRGSLPPLDEIISYREAIAASAKNTLERIADRAVGAPDQLAIVADRLLRSMIDHEYQHAKWIDEVRGGFTSVPSPAPASDRLVAVDGYWMIQSAPPNFDPAKD